MSIKSIETTPNPNSMKLNLEAAVDGKPATYTRQNPDGCPDKFRQLLEIEGVQSIFICNQFITVNRTPTSDWQPILEAAHKAMASENEAQSNSDSRETAEHEGQVSVFVQTFRGIPIQVKVTGSGEEKRLSLGARFNDAATKVQDALGADFLKERYWAEHGVRYGDPVEIAQEVFEELTGVINDDELERLVASALGRESPDMVPQNFATFSQDLDSEDWSRRLKALQDMGVHEEFIPLLVRALSDAHSQVRRLAAAALGATGNKFAVDPLCQALLSDTSVGVRRTAGDALSDLGDVAAESAMCSALVDGNKLVRWRAARFLSEVGTSESIPSLENALDDPEFEVRLEAQTAIDRIKGGTKGVAPAWKRIVENGI